MIYFHNQLQVPNLRLIFPATFDDKGGDRKRDAEIQLLPSPAVRTLQPFVFVIIHYSIHPLMSQQLYALSIHHIHMVYEMKSVSKFSKNGLSVNILFVLNHMPRSIDIHPDISGVVYDSFIKYPFNIPLIMHHIRLMMMMMMMMMMIYP